ncbi:MAG: hypothetical protein ACYTG0_21095 [Planctomycetota bacterium]
MILPPISVVVAAAHAIPGDDEPAVVDHPEVTRLFKADQSARSDFFEMTPARLQAMLTKDRARRARVRELYQGGFLKTAADYYHAAMVFQHGETPEDFLLAHELSVAALALGDDRGRWLSAATEDRFLRSIGRKQRFGTQYGKGDAANDQWELFPVDETAPDSIRKVMGCPTLSEAKLKVKELNQKNRSTGLPPSTSPDAEENADPKDALNGNFDCSKAQQLVRHTTYADGEKVDCYTEGVVEGAQVLLVRNVK